MAIDIDNNSLWIFGCKWAIIMCKILLFLLICLIFPNSCCYSENQYAETDEFSSDAVFVKVLLYHNVTPEMTNADNYTWLKIADNQWIAYNEEWEIVYPAKEKEEFIQLKALDKKDE